MHAGGVLDFKPATEARPVPVIVATATDARGGDPRPRGPGVSSPSHGPACCGAPRTDSGGKARRQATERERAHARAQRQPRHGAPRAGTAGRRGPRPLSARARLVRLAQIARRHPRPEREHRDRLPGLSSRARTKPASAAALSGHFPLERQPPTTLSARERRGEPSDRWQTRPHSSMLIQQYN
jgi:hypothetical protein